MGKQGWSVGMAVCCVGLLATPAQATVNQSMQDWFNDIGAYGKPNCSERYLSVGARRWQYRHAPN